VAHPDEKRSGISRDAIKKVLFIFNFLWHCCTC
jgi:hypothetical protein